jgi:non-ribosomal peptide synthetase component F
VVGTPVAGRTQSDLEGMIGMFVNTLGIRVQPGGDQTFAGFLSEVKKTVLKAFDNQDYPFEYLVEKVVQRRENGRNPLFDVMFVLQNLDLPEISIKGLTLTPYRLIKRISKFDLTLIGIARQDKLAFTLEYSTGLFKLETIDRYIGYFQEIATVLADNPGIKLKDIQVSVDLVEPESEMSQEADGDFAF